MKICDAPILEYDDDDNSEAVEHFFNQGKKDFKRFQKAIDLNIDGCVIFLSRAFESLPEIFSKCELIYEFKSASTISPVYIYDGKILIALSPLGGPAAANLIEELSFVGIKKFFALGTCGCIRPDIDENMLIVPTSAIRDEGLSYHYLPASREVETTPEAVRALGNSLKRFSMPFTYAKVWTCDAIYRETPNRTARRRDEGAVAVEMECASMASIAKYKKLCFGQVLYISDFVEENKWKLRVYDRVSLRTQLTLVCIDACLSLPKRPVKRFSCK